MKVENKSFNVDYKGWEDRSYRSYQDVREIFIHKGLKLFEHWAGSALFGDNININGINIECVPPISEVERRARVHISLP